MSESESSSPTTASQTFSFTDKRLFRSFLKLFCNHITENPDQSGELLFNLQLERFGAYESNKAVIKDLLNDIVKAFGASIFIPHYRRGEPIELSNEGVYLENTRVVPDNILEALDLLDEPVKEALIHQCFLDAIKAPKRSTEGKYLQRYLDQSGLEIGPGSDQSLKAFTTLLKCYHDVIKVLAILVEVHQIKAR